MQHRHSELRSLIAQAVGDTEWLLPRSGQEGRWPPATQDQFRVTISQLRAQPLGMFGDISADLEALSKYLQSLSSLDRYFDDTRSYLRFIESPLGSVSVGLPVAEAASRIVMGAIVHSVDVATDTLHAFLERGSFPMTLIFFLAGTNIDHEITLDGHSRLVPMREALELVKPLISADMRLPDPSTVGCALLTESDVHPGTWDSDLSIDASVDLHGVAAVDIGVLCGLLTLVTQRRFQPVGSTSLVDQAVVDTLPIAQGQMGGWGVSNHLTPFMGSEPSIPFVDVAGLRSLVAEYQTADEEFRRRLRLPLARFQATTARLEHADRCIDLAIAFEAMLTTRKEWSLTKRLAERSAWLYAQTGQEREWAGERVRDFYDHRSAFVHGEAVADNADLYSDAQSIFIVCLRNMVTRGAYPDWGAIDVVGTLGNPEATDPSTILSAKHDTTSWTVGELQRIDDELSAHWQGVLGTIPAGSGGGTEHAQGNVAQVVTRLEQAGTPYMVADPEQLAEKHPMWQEASANGDEARIWHCGNDIRRHLRLWMEAARKKGVTVVVDDASPYLRDHLL